MAPFPAAFRSLSSTGLGGTRRVAATVSVGNAVCAYPSRHRRRVVFRWRDFSCLAKPQVSKRDLAHVRAGWDLLSFRGRRDGGVCLALSSPPTPRPQVTGDQQARRPGRFAGWGLPIPVAYPPPSPRGCRSETPTRRPTHPHAFGACMSERTTCMWSADMGASNNADTAIWAMYS